MKPEVAGQDLVCANDVIFDRTSGSLCLDAPATAVSQVSPARAKALAGMGIETVRDLLTNFPRRYIDLSRKVSIAQAVVGESYTICGTIHEVKLKKPRRNLSLTEITLVDGTGTLILTMFRMPWLANQLQAGDRLAVAGPVEFNYGFKRMTNPMFERLDGNSEANGMIVPVHPACEKVSAVMMRRLVNNALVLAAPLPDILPISLRINRKLMSRARAFECIHAPRTLDEARQARKRIAYEELLMLQLRLGQETLSQQAGETPTSHVIGGPLQRALAEHLPFALTEDQARAREDVNRVMAETHCANHLILGDVGTGKTIVAAFAIAAAADSGSQTFLMAPTEVLATQHAQSLGALFDEIGITWELLTGSTSKDARAGIVGRAAQGTIDVLIGTHALLEDDVTMPHCTLAIIDEQQRFGVDQRRKLASKGSAPDALYLTATPIPRTLALAIYGNLTLSYLHQRPRAALRTTKVLPKTSQGTAYDAALEACKRGEQAYVVCPLVGVAPAEEGGSRDANEERYEYASVSIEDEDDFAQGDITAATEHAAFLQRKVFVDYEVGILHGKMKPAEKAEVMDRFRRNEIQVLVSTTVIEVGVDVPNATVMIIEDADRFGLSQLHQLRGRVGRGEKSAQVFLVSANKGDDALRRLRAMETTDDGMELATYDLSLRREGDILGNRQHGASSLKLVNVTRDAALIEAAHEDAKKMLACDPELRNPEHQLLSREMRKVFDQDKIAIGG